MPDISGLYPQPPQPGQGLLTGDPLRTIGAMGQLQDIGIRAQQAPALAQIPAANLQSIQTSIQAQHMAMQADVRMRYLTALANSFPGKATADQIRNFSANYATQNPVDATTFPGIINGVTHEVVGDPLGIPHALTQAQQQTLSPGQSTAEAGIGYDPNTGQPITGTKAQQLERIRGGPAGASPGGGIALTPPMGSETSVTQMQADKQKAAQFPQSMFPWTQALQKLNELGPGATGPGSEGRQALEEYVYSLAPSIAPYLGVDASKIKNYSDMRKYLVQAMQQRANSMGPHTNEGLSVASTGSPNVHINDMSVGELIKSQMILQRMEQAQILQASKKGGINYNDEKAKLAGQFDPRAFGMDLMEPKDRDAYIKGLKGDARKNAQISLQAAYDNNIITRPGQ